MGKVTKKDSALHRAQRSSMTRTIIAANDKHVPSTTEPGALAVNPLSPVTADTSSRSFHSDSSTHLMDGSHTTSDSQVTSPVITAARRKTHLLTSIPMDVQRNSSASSAGEPPVVGAHSMTTTRSSAPPMTHKLQALPAGSHAALSRQAHNANSKQRLSLSSSSHHSAIPRNSARSVLGTNPTNDSNRTIIGASSFADHHGEPAGLRRSDRRAAKMGYTQGQSSRLSVGSMESHTGMIITGEVDVDELQLHVGMKTAIPTESPVAEYDVTVPALSNMVSAHLVVEDEEDEEAGGRRRMTEEERNALFEQAQRQAEEALHEKMMSNMVTAEEVVDEEALKQQARRLQCWTRCGIVALIVLVGGILGATKPWKKNNDDPMDMMQGPPPPINDVCTAAITMEWGTDTQWQDGTTIGASDSKLPSCTSDDEFVWGKSSVWYRIVGTGSPLRISSNATLAVDNDDGLLGNTTIPWNAVLSVYSGQCGALMCIGSTSSNEDDPMVIATDAPTDHDATVTWFAEEGVDYFVCVHGAFREEGTREDDPYSGTTYGNGRDSVDANPDDAPPLVMMTAGNFSLSVDQAVGNDFCPGAVGLEVSSTDGAMSSSSHHYYHQGSTNQATPDSEYEFCGNTHSTAPGVWYRVNGTGTPLEVIVRPQQDDNFNTQVTVFKSPMGLDCSELVCITGDNELFQHSSHATWLSEEGTVYFILVHGASNHRGSFELLVEERVTNDMCESATALKAPKGDWSGEANTLMGTLEGSSMASALGVCGKSIHAGRSVWYTLEGTGKKMRMSTCHSPSSSLESFDTVLSVFRGEDCSNLECIDGNDSLSCGSSSSGAVIWDTEAGQLYHILVSGKLVEETGTFQLSWEEVL